MLKGEGGIGNLGDEEKAGIKETIEDEILDGAPITYRGGELTLNGVTRPLEFTFDGTEGRAEVKQTDFKIKPYSALFGTLKVADVVEVKVRTSDGWLNHPSVHRQGHGVQLGRDPRPGAGSSRAWRAARSSSASPTRRPRPRSRSRWARCR